MIETKPLKEPSLEAKSPFELRVNLGQDIPGIRCPNRAGSRRHGFSFLHFTGSTVDGPGVRVVAWTTGCHWRCLYLRHNPDTWTVTNGIPVSVVKALEELRKYRSGFKVMSGGLTLSGGEPLMQDRFAVKLLSAAHGMGIHTAMETNGSLWWPSRRLRNWTKSTCSFWVSRRGIRNDTAGSPDWRSVQPWILRAAWLRAGNPGGCASYWCQGSQMISAILLILTGIRRQSGQRGTSRGSALPSNGQIQMEGTQTQLHARWRAGLQLSMPMKPLAHSFVPRDSIAV